MWSQFSPFFHFSYIFARDEQYGFSSNLPNQVVIKKLVIQWMQHFLCHLTQQVENNPQFANPCEWQKSLPKLKVAESVFLFLIEGFPEIPHCCSRYSGAFVEYIQLCLELHHHLPFHLLLCNVAGLHNPCCTIPWTSLKLLLKGFSTF